MYNVDLFALAILVFALALIKIGTNRLHSCFSFVSFVKNQHCSFFKGPISPVPILLIRAFLELCG